MNGAAQAGFIPDVVRLLEKYNLSGNLDTYMKDSIFRCKISSQRMVKCKINTWKLYQWHSRTSQPEFARFQRVFPAFHFHYFWTLSNKSPKIVNACKFAIQIIGSILDYDVQLCCKCNLFYDNVVDHCL